MARPFFVCNFFLLLLKIQKYLQKWANPAGRVLIGSVLIDKTWIWTKNSYNWNPNFRDPETCFIYIRYIIMQIYPKIFLIHLPNYVQKAFNVIFHVLKKIASSNGQGLFQLRKSELFLYSPVSGKRKTFLGLCMRPNSWKYYE